MKNMNERILWCRKGKEYKLPAIGQIIGCNNITTSEHYQGTVVSIDWDEEKQLYAIKLKGE